MEFDKMNLPILQFEGKIVEIVDGNPIAVIIGETGSGKSTQLSQILHRRGYTKSGIIAVTQPRRVATVSVARRVAQELGVQLGEEVGYAIRFEDRTSAKTCIKYLTDGLLLRESLSNPELSQYSVIILDEAHERSLNTDILLGLMRRLINLRTSNLKVLITSATLDGEKVSRFFSNCPILNVPGKLFPVEILHSLEPSKSYVDASLEMAIDVHVKEPEGDVLIFMTGQNDIEKLITKLEERIQRLEEGSCMDAIVLPLHGSLPPELQVRVFSRPPPNCRRFIVATNIAETSLTVDGVVYVIDSGYVKQRHYNPSTGMYSLDVVQISKVQANQRAGRAGRTRPGKCYRLYPSIVYHDDFLDATIPEIQRSSLAGSVLYLKSLDLPDIDILKFDFLDPPSSESLEDALRQLFLIDAIDEDGSIASLGQKMADFGLTKLLVDEDAHVMTVVAGTFGYLAPAPQPTLGGLQQAASPWSRSFSEVLLNDCPGSSLDPTKARPDAAIVLAQMKMGLHKGSPAVFFEEELISEFAKPLRWVLVGKFSLGFNKSNPKLGRPPIENIEKFFVALDLKASVLVGLLDNRHISIQLGSEADFLRLYSRRSLVIEGHIMRIFKWHQDFHLEKESSMYPAWIFLPRLPLHFFNRTALFGMMNLIGTPLRIDAATATLRRPSLAKVQVEIDLLKHIPEKIWIGTGKETGFWQKIVVDYLPSYCTHCWHIGHGDAHCTVKFPHLKNVEKGNREGFKQREVRMEYRLVQQTQNVSKEGVQVCNSADDSLQKMKEMDAAKCEQKDLLPSGKGDQLESGMLNTGDTVNAPQLISEHIIQSAGGEKEALPAGGEEQRETGCRNSGFNQDEHMENLESFNNVQQQDAICAEELLSDTRVSPQRQNKPLQAAQVNSSQALQPSTQVHVISVREGSSPVVDGGLPTAKMAEQTKDMGVQRNPDLNFGPENFVPVTGLEVVLIGDDQAHQIFQKVQNTVHQFGKPSSFQPLMEISEEAE